MDALTVRRLDDRITENYDKISELETNITFLQTKLLDLIEVIAKLRLKIEKKPTKKKAVSKTK